jgi:hypothetical protein
LGLVVPTKVKNIGIEFDMVHLFVLNFGNCIQGNRDNSSPLETKHFELDLVTIVINRKSLIAFELAKRNSILLELLRYGLGIRSHESYVGQHVAYGMRCSNAHFIYFTWGSCGL